MGGDKAKKRTSSNRHGGGQIRGGGGGFGKQTWKIVWKAKIKKK